MANKTGASARREELRMKFWPNETLWTGEKEQGWFKAPRTLPLILSLLGLKEISGTKDPSKVYLDLLSRHVDGGVVEMAHELEHAFAAGYAGKRAIRTWTERMEILEKHGFILTTNVGNQKYKYVGLVHPTVAVQRLKEKNKLPKNWWNAYAARKTETKERSYEKLLETRTEKKVVLLEERRKAK